MKKKHIDHVEAEAAVICFTGRIKNASLAMKKKKRVWMNANAPDFPLIKRQADLHLRVNTCAEQKT